MEKKKVVPFLFVCYRHSPKSRTRSGKLFRPFFTRGNKHRIIWMEIPWNVYGVCALCEKHLKAVI